MVTAAAATTTTATTITTVATTTITVATTTITITTTTAAAASSGLRLRDFLATTIHLPKKCREYMFLLLKAVSQINRAWQELAL